MLSNLKNKYFKKNLFYNHKKQEWVKLTSDEKKLHDQIKKLTNKILLNPFDYKYREKIIPLLKKWYELGFEKKKKYEKLKKMLNF